MASRQLGNIHGYVVPGGEPGNGGASATNAHNDTDQVNLSAMRSRLAAINGTVYTTARLNQMTMNDMQFAIRNEDLPAQLGIL